MTPPGGGGEALPRRMLMDAQHLDSWGSCWQVGKTVSWERLGARPTSAKAFASYFQSRQSVDGQGLQPLTPAKAALPRPVHPRWLAARIRSHHKSLYLPLLVHLFLSSPRLGCRGADFAFALKGTAEDCQPQSGDLDLGVCLFSLQADFSSLPSHSGAGNHHYKDRSLPSHWPFALSIPQLLSTLLEYFLFSAKLFPSPSFTPHRCGCSEPASTLALAGGNSSAGFSEVTEGSWAPARLF